MIGAFVDGRSLLTPGIATWGRGSAPLLGAFEVDANSAAFITQAKQRIASLKAAADQIGPPRMLDFGSSYGEKWEPIISGLMALTADAQQALAVGSPERAEMMRALTDLNNAVFRVRSEGSSDAYKMALAVLTMNPTLAMDVVVRTAASAGGLASDTGRQITKDMTSGCSLLRVMTDPVGVWTECVPWYARWAAYAVAAGAALNAVGAFGAIGALRRK